MMLNLKMERCMRSYAVFFLLCDATGKREVIIITEEQIQNKIYSYLVTQNEHVILEHMPDHYYNLFWNSISILYEGGILTTAKSVEKFCNKLQLRGSYNRDKCLQGISEMVFWLYAIRRNYSFEIDKQLHTKNEKNNSDVDIQIVKDGYTFNIEVKTPNQVKKTDESILNITIPFRSFERKDIQDEEVRKINRDISQAIINNSQGKYTAYEQTKIDDNKVIEYLRSGQTKFTYEPKCPKCGADVVKGKFGAYCTGKCGMNVGKALGVTLSDSQVKSLLGGKKILVKGLKGKKGSYDAYLIPDNIEEFFYTKDGKKIKGFQYKFKTEYPTRKLT